MAWTTQPAHESHDSGIISPTSNMVEQQYAMLYNQKPAHVVESQVDDLYQGGSHTVRRTISRRNIMEILTDALITTAAVYFLVFAWLVYAYRGHLIDHEPSASLIKASRYGPTIFPIVFAAIVGRSLRALAAYKLEQGATVMTLEYLLQSRSVFNAFVAPFTLRTFSFLTPILIVTWALSPLGGQATLRVIGTGPHSTNIAKNFTYVSFVSPFTNSGVRSTTNGLLPPINAAFMGSLFSSAESKASHQDLHGNIKVPLYEALAPSDSANGSDWRSVPSQGDVSWSSLTGVPVYGFESSAVSRFTLNTAYMKTQCDVSGQKPPDHPYFSRQNLSAMAPFSFSGANLAINANISTQASLVKFDFWSLADTFNNGQERLLTTAACNVSMSYVEVQVECAGKDCHSLAVRPSPNPAVNLTSTIYSRETLLTNASVLNGLGGTDASYIYFFPNFINATNPSLACDTTTCVPSGIEGYIALPDSPFSLSESPRLAELGNVPFSQRLTQLLNTYWIDSIAPFAIAGNFTPSLDGDTDTMDIRKRYTYNTDTATGSAETRVEVIVCNYAWLAILIISSLTLVSCGIASIIFSMKRSGPDIFDRFSTLLRDNPHVPDPGASSMEDSLEKTSRLRNVVVRLGDVQPNEDVGYAAITGAKDNAGLRKLGRTRTYL